MKPAVNIASVSVCRENLSEGLHTLVLLRSSLWPYRTYVWHVWNCNLAQRNILAVLEDYLDREDSAKRGIIVPSVYSNRGSYNWYRYEGEKGTAGHP